MGFTNSDNEVQKMTALAASDYARRLVEAESRGHGDVEGALTRIEMKYGISRWQLSHLRGGRAKSCDVSLYARIRGAYLDMCQRQLNRLQHELAIETAKGGDDDLADMEAEALALAKRIAARKAQS